MTTVKLRTELVRLAQREDANLSQLRERSRISRETGYKWLARFRRRGEVERSEPTSWLANAKAFRAPAPSRRSSGTAAPRAFVRFQRDRPNELWQMDFKGHFPTASGRCHPLTVLDDHSRYCVGLLACADERGATVQTHLTAIFRRFGLPERILCDNGPPWGTTGAETPWTGLTVWLLKLGVRVSHGRAFHPQTQGKDERFHRTLDVEVIQRQTWPDVASCQRRFDPWRRTYNHERPHESLGMDVPASRYQVSEREFPETLGDWEYGATDAVRKVSVDGTISYKGKALPLGKASRGERVAVRPTTTDNVMKIFFGIHEIAEFDLSGENPTLRPRSSSSREPCGHTDGVENPPRHGDRAATDASPAEFSRA